MFFFKYFLILHFLLNQIFNQIISNFIMDKLQILFHQPAIILQFNLTFRVNSHHKNLLFHFKLVNRHCFQIIHLFKILLLILYHLINHN